MCIRDRKTGYHTVSILCMPILDHEDEVVGVAQIMNKMVDGNPAVFTRDDEQVPRRRHRSRCTLGILRHRIANFDD